MISKLYSRVGLRQHTFFLKVFNLLDILIYTLGGFIDGIQKIRPNRT